ncbi:unnamed protein product [Amoebophrya sp. A25]|nr:unnamed protein product [Amoebophrya sp. A25]|eukprot:GSA25T00003478001.1
MSNLHHNRFIRYRFLLSQLHAYSYRIYDDQLQSVSCTVLSYSPRKSSCKCERNHQLLSALSTYYLINEHHKKNYAYYPELNEVQLNTIYNIHNKFKYTVCTTTSLSQSLEGRATRTTTTESSHESCVRK